MNEEFDNPIYKKFFMSWLTYLNPELIYKGKTKSGIFYSFKLPYSAISPSMIKSNSVFNCEIVLFNEDNTPMVDRIMEGSFTSFFSVPLNSENKSYRKFWDGIKDACKVVFNSVSGASRRTEKTVLLEAKPEFDVKKIFKDLVEAHNWESIDDFIENRAYPKFIVYKKVQKPRLTKGNFYNLFVAKLKALQSYLADYLDKDDDECYLDLPHISITEAEILLSLLNAVSEKDTPFLNRINREWNLEDNYNIPEQVIYDMAFPDDDPLAKPIPLKVSDIEKRLREKKCLLSKRGIQKLCDKLHIPRDKAKTGRCPKTTK